MLSHDQWFLLFYYLVMANVVLGTPLLLLLGLLAPKEIKRRYFCVPHYTDIEIKWLRIFPLSLIAHASLAAMFVWPRLGKKRQIVPKGGELRPVYRLAMWFYFVFTVTTVPLALMILLGLVLNSPLTG